MRLRSVIALLMISLVQPAAAQMAVHGTFDVGDDGSAQYAIPIPAVPGVTALQPHLSLVYLSTGGNGLLGMGWSIAGLSSVARCPRTWAQDGLASNGDAPGGIHFNDNDRLCLDGQRLIQVASTGSQGGTEFRTEIDGFSRIIAFGTDPMNPTYVEVESKSGLISIYGNTPDSNVAIAPGSTITRQWALNSVADRFGHTMTVTYTQSLAGTQSLAAGTFLPQRIDYSWPYSDGISTGASVLFSYTASRPDVVQTYVWGSMLQNSYLISEIDTVLQKADKSTQPVTQYHFNYTTAPTGSTNTALQTSLLANIQACAGPAPAGCLPSVRFTYTTGTVDGSETPDFKLVPSSAAILATDLLYPGDYFGDGVDGLLVIAGPQCSSTCWSGWKLFRNTSSGITLVASNPNGPGYQNGARITVADLLGTGRPGFIATYPITTNPDPANPTPTCSAPGVYTPNPNGSGFTLVATGPTATLCYYPPSSYFPIGLTSTYSGNFLGTGQMTLLYVNGSGWQIWAYNAAAEALNMIAHAPNYWTGPTIDDSIHVGTFAGDGTSQVLTVSTGCCNSFAPLAVPYSGWRLYSFDGANMNLVSSGYTANGPDRYNAIYTGNFGGDGKASLFVVPLYVNKQNQASWSGWTLWRSTGNGLVLSGQGTGLAGGERFFVADLNGDGRDGVVSLGDPTNQATPDVGWTLLQSNGFTMLNAASGSFPSNTETITVGSYFHHSGSGIAVTTPTQASSGWKLYDTNWQQPRFMLTSLNNGMTNTSITYQALNAPGVHTPGTGAVYPQLNINPSIPVVTGISTDDGVGGQRTNSYTYAGLLADQTGRGLLGFACIISTQNEAGMSVTKTFSQTFPYAGLITNLAGYVTPSGGSQVQTSSVVNTYGCQAFTVSSCSPVAPGLRYFVYKSGSTTQTWDLNGTAFQPQTVASTFGDGMGNETQTQTTTGDGYSTVTTRTFNNDTSDWLIGRLTQINDQRTSP